MQANNLPLLAAINALLKIIHALLDVAREHVIFVDLGSALLDDLVADLGQQALHSLSRVVVLAQLEDNPHAVQSFRQNLWDVLWLGLLNLSAWFTQGIQKLKVVFGFLPSDLNLLLEGLELLEVAAISSVKHFDNLFEILVLKPLDEHVKVSSSLVPVGNFVKRTVIAVA